MNGQEKLIMQVNEFIVESGLLRKYVAKKCNIKEYIFSRFLHGKAYLSPKQVDRVLTFINDYTEKHEGNKLAPKMVMMHFQCGNAIR